MAQIGRVPIGERKLTMEFYSGQRAAESSETEKAALLTEKQADEQEETNFETKPEHL